MRSREPDDVPIGTQLMSEILQHRLKLGDVARRADMKIGTLNKVLAGDTDPKYSTVTRIRAAIAAADPATSDEAEVR